jgi:parvulin-like peptidyl-prolyl isomerase
MKSPCLPLLALSLTAGLCSAEILERIVAKVNGDIVTLSDLENRQLAAIQAAGIPNDQVPAFLREHGERILQQTIDEMLLYQKGEEMGIAERVTNEYLDRAIQEIKKENNIESDEVFRQQLSREGLTLEGLRRNIKRTIVRQQVVSMNVDSKIALTEEELRKEYQSRRAEYTKPAALKLQEIVLKPDNAETRAKAADLAKRVRGGEDFSALAKQFSVGATKAAGGDLGTVALGELHAEVRKSTANAAPGYVTDPISLGGTVRIVKVNERQDARTIPYDEAREELTRLLKKERRDAELEKFVKSLRDESEIERRIRDAPVTTDIPAPGKAPLLHDTTTINPTDLPSTTVPSANAPTAPTLGEDEVTVSPQDRPTKVSPGAPTPTPTPTAVPPR